MICDIGPVAVLVRSIFVADSRTLPHHEYGWRSSRVLLKAAVRVENGNAALVLQRALRFHHDDRTIKVILLHVRRHGCSQIVAVDCPYGLVVWPIEFI